MIRMLIAMLLALGALVGVSLRFERDRDERAAIAEPEPPPLVHTVELIDSSPPKAPKLRPIPAAAPAPVPVVRAELEEEEISAHHSASFVEAPLAASPAPTRVSAGAPIATPPHARRSPRSGADTRVAALDQERGGPVGPGPVEESGPRVPDRQRVPLAVGQRSGAGDC